MKNILLLILLFAVCSANAQINVSGSCSSDQDAYGDYISISGESHNGKTFIQKQERLIVLVL